MLVFKNMRTSKNLMKHYTSNVISIFFIGSIGGMHAF